MAELERVLPLFPLPNVVHFPRTDLPLHIFEPRYRELIRNLLELPPAERLIGMVLSVREPDSESARGRRQLRLLSPGTAGRLVAIEPREDGRFDIVLRGDFRFAILAEVEGRSYLRARVQPLPEETEDDSPLAGLARQLLGDAALLVGESGDDFPLAASDLVALSAPGRYAELVNRLAAGLDLPIVRRHYLLSLPLVERAQAVASVIASRRRFSAALTPYRHLAGAPERN